MLSARREIMFNGHIVKYYTYGDIAFVYSYDPQEIEAVKQYEDIEAISMYAKAS